MSRLARLLVFVVFAALLAACGGDGDTSATTAAPGAESTTTTAAGSQTTTTAGAGATTTTAATTTSTAATTTTLGVPSLDEVVSDATLEDLLDLLDVDRFRQRITASIVAEDESMSGNFDALYEFVRDPKSLHLVFTAEQDGAPETFELISIENTAWVYDGSSWEELPGDFADLFLSTATVPLAGGLTGNVEDFADTAVFVGREDVNGRSTLHYRFDETTLPPDIVGENAGEVDVDRVEGNVWVDEEKGFMVKATFLVEGTDVESGSSFTMNLEVEVFDIDADFTIEPPE